jgi:hypothetical protein
MKTGPQHKAFRDDLIKLLEKHSGHLDAVEMLALGGHMVGQILALQDQRTMTPEAGMKIIMQNIQVGNAEAIAQVTGGAPHGHA